LNARFGECLTNVLELERLDHCRNELHGRYLFLVMLSARLLLRLEVLLDTGT